MPFDWLNYCAFYTACYCWKAMSLFMAPLAKKLFYCLYCGLAC